MIWAESKYPVFKHIKTCFCNTKNKGVCQTSKMELFVKIIDGWEPLVIFDVWQGSEYVSRVKYLLVLFVWDFFKKTAIPFPLQ